jgi:dTDP-4-dehydrorhamnose reductase
MPKPVYLIGASGMLGQKVEKVFLEAGYPISAFSRRRNAGRYFEFSGQTADEVREQLQLQDGAYLVNCVGWIPQKSVGVSNLDNRNAFMLNVALPKVLEELSISSGIKVLQIATDCVYDGSKGRYTETSEYSPSDLYGSSKVQGERIQQSAMSVRASIVGPDLESSAGLYSWYKSKKSTDVVIGFTNHSWNGVTTRALARLFLGVVSNDLFFAGVQHWTPFDIVNKFELLRLFKTVLSEEGAIIRPGLSQFDIDRTLSTTNAKRSNEFWALAGYSEVPSISSLVQEIER